METKVTHLLLKLRSLPFIKDIEKINGSVLCVGGVVRDAFLEKESKDFDIMITHVPFADLVPILEKYGKVDLVGESFGIIKFKEFGSKEDIDISLPRKETATGERGHKAFEITTDPFLPIEEDLMRRDFTMNSIALDLTGKIIDPFHGLQDIEDEIIHYTNADAFFEDPLRMLRAVQFASRFNFVISFDTMKLIQENAERIKEIAPERIVIELEKIPTKGNCFIGADLLVKTLLAKHIFDCEVYVASHLKYGESDMENVRTVAEFLFMFRKNLLLPKVKTSIFWRDTLKGDTKTFKEILALEEIETFIWMSGFNLMAMCFFKAFKIFPDVIKTTLWIENKWFKQVLEKFVNDEFPKSLKHLAIKGDDLVSLGFKDKEIGEKFDLILSNIFNHEIKNERDSILEFLSK